MIYESLDYIPPLVCYILEEGLHHVYFFSVYPTLGLFYLKRTCLVLREKVSARLSYYLCASERKSYLPSFSANKGNLLRVDFMISHN